MGASSSDILTGLKLSQRMAGVTESHWLELNLGRRHLRHDINGKVMAAWSSSPWGAWATDFTRRVARTLRSLMLIELRSSGLCDYCMLSFTLPWWCTGGVIPSLAGNSIRICSL